MGFEKLGYYAMDSDKNLWQYEWRENDEFCILKDGELVPQDHNDYEVLEIGFIFSK